MRTIAVPLIIALSSGLFVSCVPSNIGSNCTSAKKPSFCSDESVVAQVEKACSRVETLGSDAIPEINEMRYDCCGDPNYVWINDFNATIIVHPVKSAMNGKDASEETDPTGKKLFHDFIAAARNRPSGSWVEYMWPQPGETTPTPKKSWIRRCRVGKTTEYWVVGSGTWK